MAVGEVEVGNYEYKNSFIMFVMNISGFQALMVGHMRRGLEGVIYFRSIFHRYV
jgi:hypothetical protein